MIKKTQTQTFKIRVCTLGKLRLIYALTGISMLDILDRLVSSELERVQAEKK